MNRTTGTNRKDIPNNQCVDCGSHIKVKQMFSHHRCNECLRAMWMTTFNEMKEGA